MARAGFRAIRREMLRAINAAADQYEARGQFELPDDFHKHMAEVLNDLQSKTAMQSVIDTQRQIDAQKKFDWSALALRLFEEFSLAFVAQKVTRIGETTRKRVKRIIDQGAAEAATTPEIAKRIKASSQVFTRYDAARIARTEVHGMYGYAAMQTASLYADESIFVNEWISVEDDRTRTEPEGGHRRANGQIREFGQTFYVGGEQLRFPGDPNGRADNTINCRCAVVQTRRDEL